MNEPTDEEVIKMLKNWIVSVEDAVGSEFLDFIVQ